MDGLKKLLADVEAKVAIQTAPNKEVQREIAELSEVRSSVLRPVGGRGEGKFSSLPSVPKRRSHCSRAENNFACRKCREQSLACPCKGSQEGGAVKDLG